MLNQPPDDLLDFLRNDPCPELGDTENVGSPSNRHLRLFVAAWVLPRVANRHGEVTAFDIRRALQLYEGSGNPGLLDSPGRLEVAGVYAEVLCLLTDAALERVMRDIGRNAKSA